MYCDHIHCMWGDLSMNFITGTERKWTRLLTLTATPHVYEQVASNYYTSKRLDREKAVDVFLVNFTGSFRWKIVRDNFLRIKDTCLFSLMQMVCKDVMQDSLLARCRKKELPLSNAVYCSVSPYDTLNSVYHDSWSNDHNHYNTETNSIDRGVSHHHEPTWCKKNEIVQYKAEVVVICRPGNTCADCLKEQNIFRWTSQDTRFPSQQRSVVVWHSSSRNDAR